MPVNAHWHDDEFVVGCDCTEDDLCTVTRTVGDVTWHCCAHGPHGPGQHRNSTRELRW